MAEQEKRIIVPLSFTNIYETAKTNDPLRRTHLARVQSTISGGKVVEVITYIGNNYLALTVIKTCKSIT